VQTEALHEIETPEYVVFEFELAGLATRGLAWCIDVIVVVALFIALIAVLLLVGIASQGWLLGPALALAFVGLFLLQWGYFVLFEWLWRGQTPGKRALGLRVLQETGVRVGFYHCLVRNLLRILDGLPAQPLVGGLVALLGSRRQRIGDVVAGTVVVCERTPPLPSAVVPPSERYNSLVEDRAAAARVRGRVSPELREAMTALALRREALETTARIDLFRRMSEHLQALGLERPPSLSDERFVLGVTAAALGATRHG
jgi:uncharacterized RDD family membrane protein YckC